MDESPPSGRFETFSSKRKADVYDNEVEPVPILDLAEATRRGKQIMHEKRRHQAQMESQTKVVHHDADEVVDRVVRAFDAVAKKADESRDIFTRRHLSTDLLRDVRGCGGDQRLDAIRMTLNNLGYTRSQFQKMFHDKFIQACLPIIYGSDWELNSERAMAEMGLKKLRPEVLVQTPRRFGKTVSVAMFVLAMLLCVPGIRICIFSTGKRASSGLMTEIMDRLQCIEDGHDRIVKQNQEQLFLSTIATKSGANSEKSKRQINDRSTSRLYSFPAGTAS